jgi:hypothetical protein
VIDRRPDRKGQGVIVVEPCADGGNPRDPAAIQHLGGGSYRVFPFGEDGDANDRFALHVRARNTGRDDDSYIFEPFGALTRMCYLQRRAGATPRRPVCQRNPTLQSAADGVGSASIVPMIT